MRVHSVSMSTGKCDCAHVYRHQCGECLHISTGEYAYANDHRQVCKLSVKPASKYTQCEYVTVSLQGQQARVDSECVSL